MKYLKTGILLVSIISGYCLGFTYKRIEDDERLDTCHKHLEFKYQDIGYWQWKVDE